MGDHRHEHLPADRGLVCIEQFCEHTGLTRTTVDRLVRDGAVDGLVRSDGQTVGVYGDALPSARQLRELGLLVRDDYDPAPIRSYDPHDTESEQPETPSPRPAWTMTWSDDGS